MDDFSELETELKQLRPALVRGEVVSRIERALSQPEAGPAAGILPRPSRGFSAWWALGLSLGGAAALVLLGLAFFAEPPPTELASGQKSAAPSARLTNNFQLSALTQVVYRQRDEGLVFSPNQSEHLLRRVRYDTRETMQWRNPRTGASLRVSYPAEQVVLTPVSFQ